MFFVWRQVVVVVLIVFRFLVFIFYFFHLCITQEVAERHHLLVGNSVDGFLGAEWGGESPKVNKDSSLGGYRHMVDDSFRLLFTNSVPVQARSPMQ